jgi:hypothetical protein
MRKLAVLVPAILLGAFGQVPASAVPTHLHCMTNASGNTHAIARGITLHAPHDTAFHNFHNNVHLGAFAGNNPQTITVDLTEPFSC